MEQTQTCDYKETVDDYTRCCLNDNVCVNNETKACATVRAFRTNGEAWTDDMGNTCADLGEGLHSEVMQWCSQYGTEVNPSNGLSAHEACPGLCSVRMPPRFQP